MAHLPLNAPYGAKPRQDASKNDSARQKATAHDEAFAFLETLGATIVHPPKEGMWAPGCYSVLFEDPGGIRLEINFVPGKGLLSE